MFRSATSQWVRGLRGRSIGRLLELSNTSRADARGWKLTFRGETLALLLNFHLRCSEAVLQMLGNPGPGEVRCLPWFRGYPE